MRSRKSTACPQGDSAAAKHRRWTRHVNVFFVDLVSASSDVRDLVGQGKKWFRVLAPLTKTWCSCGNHVLGQLTFFQSVRSQQLCERNTASCFFHMNMCYTAQGNSGIEVFCDQDMPLFCRNCLGSVQARKWKWNNIALARRSKRPYIFNSLFNQVPTDQLFCNPGCGHEGWRPTRCVLAAAEDRIFSETFQTESAFAFSHEHVLHCERKFGNPSVLQPSHAVAVTQLSGFCPGQKMYIKQH